MDGDKDAERMTGQDGILPCVSTHIGKCRLLETGGGLSCPGGEIWPGAPLYCSMSQNSCILGPKQPESLIPSV